MSSYPWILQYKSGFGRVSFFQMLYGMARYDVGCSITSYYELLALFQPACPVSVCSLTWRLLRLGLDLLHHQLACRRAGVVYLVT